MAIRFSNNAQTFLASDISPSDTVITVLDASAFPALAPGDYTYVTLENLLGDIEIVKVTAISTNTLTVVRGQDGTAGRAFASGDFVQLRVTAALLNDLSEESSVTLWSDVENKPSPVLTLAGDATGSVALTELGDAILSVSVEDDSHNHTIGFIDGLQAALDSKLDVTASAVSAGRWSAARTISLTGAVTGSASVDGSGDVSIDTTASAGRSWKVKSSGYAASNYDLLIADTTAGPFSISLPSSPSSGDTVSIADGADWSSNNLTISRNGSTIEGLSEDLVMDIPGVSADFVYDGSTWQVYVSVPGTPPTITVDDDSASDITYFPALATATTGDLSSIKVSSPKLYFNPATGSLNATNFNSLSDQRKKQDIATIEGALKLVGEMRGVTYRWRDSGAKGMGVVAQELEGVIPEVVNEDRNTGEKSVSYGSLVGVLIEAVKALNEEIAAIKRVIK